MHDHQGTSDDRRDERNGTGRDDAPIAVAGRAVVLQPHRPIDAFIGRPAVTGHNDLKALVDAAEWFCTVALPAPSHHPDSAHRFQVEWANARSELAETWDADELGGLDAVVAALPHDGGAAVILVHPRGGSTLVEFLDEPVQHLMVHEGPCPRLAPLLESRQRAIPHVMVETDRAGADITAFDGGAVLSTETIDGDTLHIHRGHSGGWSQRRFQQRAENTWERNAGDVADAVATVARRIDARLIAVAGDVRAQTFVLDALPEDVVGHAVKIDAGSPDGIADEVVRLLSDQVATSVVALADRLRTELANDRAVVGTDATLRALVEGRVDTLLAHDDGTAGPTVPAGLEIADGTRAVDAAIAAALRTDAEVMIVPALAVLDGPIAALLRW